MLDVIYQDDYLVAINKPSGLLVHRSAIDRHATEFAMQMLRDQLSRHVFPVHRLDRPTSGVLLFALSSDAARACGGLFEQQRVNKIYQAITRGYVQSAGVLDYPLKEQLDKLSDKMADDDKPAQSAVSEYTPIQQFELPFAVGRYPTARYTHLELRPKTGRKHQLRRHMAHLRHPIVGDTSHGDGKHNRFLRQQFGLSSLALSCTEMSFIHPITEEHIQICCEVGPAIGDLLVDFGRDYSLKDTLSPV